MESSTQKTASWRYAHRRYPFRYCSNCGSEFENSIKNIDDWKQCPICSAKIEKSIQIEEPLTIKEQLKKIIKGVHITGIGDPFDEIVTDLINQGVLVMDPNLVIQENRPLISTIANHSINEALELLQAKEKGEIIYFPCNIGDIVYSEVNGKDEAFTVIKINLSRDANGSKEHYHAHNGECPLTFNNDNIGKSVHIAKKQNKRSL